MGPDGVGSPGPLLLLLVPSEPLSWQRRSPETPGLSTCHQAGRFSTHCHSFHLHNYPVKSVLLKPLLQMEELKLRVVKKAVPNHKASKKQIQNLNLSLSGSKACVLSSSQVASYVLGEKGK